MQSRPTQSHASAARPAARGFSFVEVLFAIGVLGIGFIMLAAIFPVGLQQTKLTIDETNGAANSRSMVSRLQQLAQTQVQYTTTTTDVKAAIPDTCPRPTAAPVVGQRYNGQVRTFNDPRPFADGMIGTQAATRQFHMWQAQSVDLIQPADARLATVTMFKRDLVGTMSAAGTPQYSPESTAQVITINAQVANQTTFVQSDVVYGLGTPTESKMAVYNLEPRPVAVQIIRDTNNGTYVASFFSVTQLDGGAALDRGGYPKNTGPNSQSWDSVLDASLGAVTEGCYVVISDDRITAPAGNIGRMNGRIFRLGTQRTDLGGLTFDLAPGFGFTPDNGTDGKFNDQPSSTTSTDDILGIGVGGNDLSASQTRSGLAYKATEKSPSDSTKNGPNANGITLAGTSANYGAVALVLGRGFNGTTGLSPVIKAGYFGPALDVSAYTTFVSVPNP